MSPERVAQVEAYSCPSWSWASVSSEFWYLCRYTDAPEMAQVIEVLVELDNADNFWMITSSAVQIQAKLGAFRLLRHQPITPPLEGILLGPHSDI